MRQRDVIFYFSDAASFALAADACYFAARLRAPYG